MIEISQLLDNIKGIKRTQLSKFLSDKRGEMEGFIYSLTKYFPYASLLATDVSSKVYSQSIKEAVAREGMGSERGFVVRIFDSDFYLEYSFSEWKPDEQIEKIRELARERRELSLKHRKYLMPIEEELRADYSSEYKISPDEISAEEIFESLSEIVESLKKGKNVVDVQASISTTQVSKVFISPKRNLSQSYIYTNAAALAVVSDGKRFKTEYKGFSGRCGMELLEELKEGTKDLVELANELLDSKKIVPGEYEIICDPDVSGLIAHEAFGHGVEMDMFVKNRAKGKEYIGERVASKIVNMRDGARSIEDAASFFFDDEGNLQGDTLIIKDGILERGLSDNLSAEILNTTPTGNGRRESYERKAYARMTNTFFEEGKDSLSEMIKSIKRGYLLEGMMSGMEDPKSWGIQCQITKGREIIDGKLTGVVVSPVLLTGYVPDLLESISMISPDIEINGGGYCGKGYKEYVKTTTGGPYIKAVGRLG